jgi:hypothetical protein
VVLILRSIIVLASADTSEAPSPQNDVPELLVVTFPPNLKNEHIKHVNSAGDLVSSPLKHTVFLDFQTPQQMYDLICTCASIDIIFGDLLKYREEFLGRFGALMQPDTYAARCTVSCC